MYLFTTRGLSNRPMTGTFKKDLNHVSLKKEFFWKKKSVEEACKIDDSALMSPVLQVRDMRCEVLITYIYIYIYIYIYK